MNMHAEFSLIIPTHRRLRELEEAVGGVLDQCGVTVEVIVIDGSGEGPALQVIEAIRDTRVTLLRNAKLVRPKNTSRVRNMGWSRAKGSFVHFLDDDIVTDGHYVAVKDASCGHPRVGMVFGRVEPLGKCPTAQLEHEKRYSATAARRAFRCQRFDPKSASVGGMRFGDALLVFSVARSSSDLADMTQEYD